MFNAFAKSFFLLIAVTCRTMPCIFPALNLFATILVLVMLGQCRLWSSTRDFVKTRDS